MASTVHTEPASERLFQGFKRGSPRELSVGDIVVVYQGTVETVGKPQLILVTPNPSETSSWHPSNGNFALAPETFESTTLPFEEISAPARELDELFASVDEQDLEKGVASELFKYVSEFLLKHDEAGLQAIESAVFSEKYPLEAVSEVVRYLGKLEYPLWSRQRRQLLEQALTLPSAEMRYSALIGLASLGDPKSITAISAAVEREKLHELRRDMHKVIRFLESK